MTRFAGRSGPIRLGMVGGGKDAFIGAVHRIASRMGWRMAHRRPTPFGCLASCSRTCHPAPRLPSLVSSSIEVICVDLC